MKLNPLLYIIESFNKPLKWLNILSTHNLSRGLTKKKITKPFKRSIAGYLYKRPLRKGLIGLKPGFLSMFTPKLKHGVSVLISI